MNPDIVMIYIIMISCYDVSMMNETHPRIQVTNSCSKELVPFGQFLSCSTDRMLNWASFAIWRTSPRGNCRSRWSHQWHHTTCRSSCRTSRPSRSGPPTSWCTSGTRPWHTWWSRLGCCTWIHYLRWSWSCSRWGKSSTLYCHPQNRTSEIRPTSRQGPSSSECPHRWKHACWP